MTDDKKILVENEDGDSAELNANLASSPEEINADNNDLNLLADLEKVKTDLAAKSDRLLRLQADFDNFRKRMAKEKTDVAAVVEQNFLTDLLPVVDNFGRALEHSETSDAETLRKGITMIWNELVKALSKHGLEVIDTENQKFDPYYHQSIGNVKDETKADGMIAVELQRGYMAHGKVIRASMVQVVNND